LVYGLVEVERTGGKRSWGPFGVEVEEGVVVGGWEGREAVKPAAAELERLERAGESKRLWVSQVAGLVSGNSGPGAVRLKVDREGLYRVGVVELAAAWGKTVEQVKRWLSRGQIRLERLGEVVAIWPEEDWGGFYFYAPGERSPYAREATYWVRKGAGRWVEGVKAQAAAVWAETVSVEGVEAEEDVWDVPALPLETGSEFWFWDVLVHGVPGYEEKTFSVGTPGAEGGGGDGRLVVRLQGANAQGHEVAVWWNGFLVGSAVWEGMTRHEASFWVPGWRFSGESGQVRLRVESAGSEVLVDSFRVEYPRRHRVVGGQLVVHPVDAAGEGVVVGGLQSEGVEVWEVRDPRRPKRLEGWKLGGVGREYWASFRAGGEKFLVAERASALAPVSMQWDGGSGIRQLRGARYVVVAPKELWEGAKVLAGRREAEGLSVALVELEDVYDEFAHGEPDPEAIRAMVRWGWERWEEKPEFLVLVGEGTYDWRDVLGLGGNRVPARLEGTPFGLMSADSGYGDVDGDGVPEVAVGRIPVLTAGELEAYLEKVAAYEAGGGAWTRRVQVVADDGPEGFEGAVGQVASRLPGTLEVEVLGIGVQGFAATRGGLMSGLQEGRAWVGYVGHGGMDRWASEGLLTMADVPGMTNPVRPWVAGLTCAINRFEVPGYASLGEELVRQPGGGAVAVWAPSGLSDHGQAVVLGQELAGAMYRKSGQRLGQVLLEGVTRYVQGAGSRDLVKLYELLGDPGLRLPDPEPVVLPPGPPGGGDG
jgi:hypothetical protein